MTAITCYSGCKLQGKVILVVLLILFIGLSVHSVINLTPPKASKLQVSQERHEELRRYSGGKGRKNKNLATLGGSRRNRQEVKKLDKLRSFMKTDNPRREEKGKLPISGDKAVKKQLHVETPVCMCCQCGSLCHSEMAPPVELYNLKNPVDPSWNFECIQLHIKPKTYICLYDPKRDIHVSKVIFVHGIWEPHIINTFQNILFNNPDIGVIDIGANLGLYSLIAARMGHNVVAVEPNIDTIYRFHQSVYNNSFLGNITLLHNAVSNVRGCTKLQQSKHNQGDTRIRNEKLFRGIQDVNGNIKCAHDHVWVVLLDDLEPYITFKTAIMKIDIQGLEHKAMSQACKLLKQVKIPYIFMEWELMRKFHMTKGHMSDDKLLVEKMIRYLVSMGYQPYSSGTQGLLEVDYWFGWPVDIVWKHRLAYTL